MRICIADLLRKQVDVGFIFGYDVCCQIALVVYIKRIAKWNKK